MSNILRVSFKHERRIESRPLYQYDYGQVLKFIDLQLPYSYEVHFSNHEKGSSITQLGNKNGVAIPDSLLTSGLPVYAWLYLHTGNADGETEYMVKIPVYKRATITNDTPTPVQQDVITQTIAALASGVAVATASASSAIDAAAEATRACGAARAYMETTQEYKDAAIAATSHYPKIEDDYWYVWDIITEQFINTDVPAKGPKGEPFTYDDFTPEQLANLTGPSGIDGVTFIPSVSSEGIISWTNDGGEQNPEPINIKGPIGLAGPTGDDGFSPLVSIVKEDNVATITITDQNGTTSASIIDGIDGAPGPSGFSPVIAVSSIAGGHQVSITDASGTQSFNVMDGTGSVQSVNDKTGVVVLTAEDVGALPSDTVIPSVPSNISAFNNDAGYITTETDPTVPAWAKASVKPSYTAVEVGALPSDTFIPSAASDIGAIPNPGGNNGQVLMYNNGTWEPMLQEKSLQLPYQLIPLSFDGTNVSTTITPQDISEGYTLDGVDYPPYLRSSFTKANLLGSTILLTPVYGNTDGYEFQSGIFDLTSFGFTGSNGLLRIETYNGYFSPYQCTLVTWPASYPTPADIGAIAAPSSAADGQLLKYNGTSQEWENDEPQSIVEGILAETYVLTVSGSTVYLAADFSSVIAKMQTSRKVLFVVTENFEFTVFEPVFADYASERLWLFTSAGAYHNYRIELIDDGNGGMSGTVETIDTGYGKIDAPGTPSAGDVLTYNGSAWVASAPSSGFPAVTSADDGKIMQVVNGVWAAASLPSASGVSF